MESDLMVVTNCIGEYIEFNPVYWKKTFYVVISDAGNFQKRKRGSREKNRRCAIDLSTYGCDNFYARRKHKPI